MKKLLTIIGLLAIGLFVQAQNYAILHIEDVPAGQGNEYHYCATEYDGIEIYAQEGCPNFQWTINYSTQYTNVDPLVLDNTEEYYFIHYSGCSNGRDFTIYFHELDVQNPFNEPLVWKRQGESITLSVNYYDYYEVHWSNGSTDWSIEVTEPGIYSVSFTSIYGCGTQTFYIEVRDNVELTSASCDLATGYNKLEWETSPEQATYVQSVNIYFDYDENCNYSELIANVDYDAGSYVDNTHDSYQYPCQYHIVAVTNDGEECPLRSYWARTISLSDLMGTQGTQTLQWTSYTTERDIAKQTTSVLAYKIYDVINGEAFYKATVGSFANTYNYDPNDFNGQGGVAAILDGAKDGEFMAFARTRYKIGDPDGTGEHHITFGIYPNPSNGMFTIHGSGILTISNMIGQTILQKEVDGESSVELPAGVYVAKLGNCIQKVVVE